MPGSTAVRSNCLPNALPRPARTPAAVVTSGSFRTAATDVMSVGVKPFCEVSA